MQHNTRKKFTVFRFFFAPLFFICVFAYATDVTATTAYTTTLQRIIESIQKRGEASWYVPGGKQLVAAHRKLPIGTIVRVTNTATGESVRVVIRDRGPFIKGRVIDLSRYAFNQIAEDTQGVTAVKIRVKQLP